MKTKFTPGPWYVGDKGIGPVSKEDDQTCGMVMEIAEVWGKNREANEFLIAAAPELYEALRGCAEALVYYGTMKPSGEFQKAIPRLCDALSEAKAALAKARGEA